MPTRRTLLTMAATLPAATLIARAALARTPAVYANEGIAVDASDVVAYFTQGEPVKGAPEHAHVWNGAEWHFATAANRDAFAADPEAYAPQYGGYCAWAVSQGYTASTIPEAWKVVGGKLYLNFNRRIQRRWERDIPGNIAAGDANWPGVLA
ncbi:YHS domain-containing (seleno)protein [Tateyamaria omphalii]|uniref:YHS domain protein n=1 Tax=Tateyamaria omphalii TaxID=299262 RepID=A0A1P8MU79_9RHOB|nr:YHS domain-containing (seleno)protein [Tateyamaria omphalii]APX11657.1 YHS domain protein [Tateyamaria omphalii]